MKDSDILGIHFPTVRKFYYFENGQHSPGQTSIDRLRSILTGRGLITMTDAGQTAYSVITLAKAKAEDLDIEVIHINKHIKQVMQSENNAKSHTGTIWD